MPNFSANLSMLYPEHRLTERFAAAAADGFKTVEILFPYELTPAELAQRLQANGLALALFNLPPGDWAAGERGLAALPGRDAEFAATVERALPYALASGCRHLHAMAGMAPPGADAALLRATFIANLRRAAAQLAPHGITLLIEPINTRDMPGYVLNLQQQAHDIVAEVGASNLAVQMDFYHCQIMQGDLETTLRKHLAGVGHIQIAGVPERHEPDTGEVNFTHLLALLDALGYAGHVGCEYRPRDPAPGGTSAGLGWLRRWLPPAPGRCNAPIRLDSR